MSRTAPHIQSAANGVQPMLEAPLGQFVLHILSEVWWGLSLHSFVNRWLIVAATTSNTSFSCGYGEVAPMPSKVML